MEILTFNVDKDRRNLTNDVQNFDIDFKNSPSWVQARQYENQMRQVQVNVQHGDGTPFDLTGANPVLEGFMPDGVHRIIDAKHGVMIDPVNGQFRFDFPAPVFAVSGSYKQIFFRLYRAGNNIATLEFSMEVLADKVISGLIPADYVTPIEDIMDKAETVFNNAAGDIDAIKKAWAAKLQDLFDSLSKTGKDTADALMQVQAGLTTLEAQIKSNGLFTQGEAADFKKSVTGAVQKMQDDFSGTGSKALSNYAYDTASGYGEALPDYFQASFDHVTNDVPKGNNIVNITSITDAHWQEDGGLFGGYARKSLEHYQWAALSTLYVKPDAFIANGDNVNGDEKRPQLLNTTNHVVAMMATKAINTPMLLVRGNHDNGAGRQNIDGKLVDEYLTETDLKNIYGTKFNNNGEVRDGDSLYFYRDFADKKVRLIGLDSYDLPWDLKQANGNYKYDTNTAAFRADQLNWLANTALKLPDNAWQVILFFHCPFSSAFDQWADDSVFKNYKHAIEIISAFKNGTQININDASETDFAISGLTADYAAQGKGTVIAVVNGHLHADKQDTNVLNGTPVICTDCSLHYHSQQNEFDDTVNEDCWETMSIDTQAKTIHCYRFGRGQDRIFNY
jgi:hypothetical protein